MKLRRVLIEVCLSLVAASASTPSKALAAGIELPAPAPEANERSLAESESSGADQGGSAADRKDPPAVKPSREPSAQGCRVAFLIGVNFLAWGDYTYDTRVTLAGAEQLQYRGRQGSLGGAFFLDPVLTLPGALRRITVGANISWGGVNWRERSVIPAGLITPFSQRNLLADIQSRASSGWHPAISPHIEHDVGFLGGNRLKAGYQYWKQMGSDAGSFRPCDNKCAGADYNVRLNLSSHLVRVSVNDYVYLDDPDNDPNTPQSRKQKSGMIRQFGVMIGTNRTVIIFAAIGAFFEIPR